MQYYAKLKNGNYAIVDHANEDVKTLESGMVMASINGGKFQPLAKSKIEEESKFPISR